MSQSTITSQERLPRPDPPIELAHIGAWQQGPLLLASACCWSTTRHGRALRKLEVSRQKQGGRKKKDCSQKDSNQSYYDRLEASLSDPHDLVVARINGLVHSDQYSALKVEGGSGCESTTEITGDSAK